MQRADSLSFRSRGFIQFLVVQKTLNTESPGKFKNAIKQWKLASCPSRPYKKYIHKRGFL